MKLRGFTLIELLMVVAIIAILAAIAVPNFLEAQIRSKVARTRSDLRTVATALELYTADNNRLPENRIYGSERILPEKLTTPIAYITSLPHDVFRQKYWDEPLRRFDYHNIRENVELGLSGWPKNDMVRYGDWRLVSYGPSLSYLPWIPYDPTNGTVSAGNVLRTQRSPEGKILFTFWDPANPEI